MAKKKTSFNLETHGAPSNGRDPGLTTPTLGHLNPRNKLALRRKTMELSGWLTRISPRTTLEFSSANTKMNANSILKSVLTKLLVTISLKLKLAAKADKLSPFRKRARGATTQA